MIELLVGKEFISSTTSPYTQEPSVNDTDPSSQEPVKPVEQEPLAESVTKQDPVIQISSTILVEPVSQNTDSIDLSTSSQDQEMVINRLFSSGKQDSNIHMPVIEKRSSHEVSTSSSIGCYHEQGVLKDLLVLLRGKLRRDEWKSHPTAKHALLWCLKQLKVLDTIYCVSAKTIKSHTLCVRHMH